MASLGVWWEPLFKEKQRNWIECPLKIYFRRFWTVSVLVFFLIALWRALRGYILEPENGALFCLSWIKMSFVEYNEQKKKSEYEITEDFPHLLGMCVCQHCTMYLSKLSNVNVQIAEKISRIWDYLRLATPAWKVYLSKLYIVFV